EVFSSVLREVGIASSPESAICVTGICFLRSIGRGGRKVNAIAGAVSCALGGGECGSFPRHSGACEARARNPLGRKPC
ncbi:hypothetical protein chiPu_0031970, partial [Chiloscyllium punctatum]|nr:hypothetical protein [Chiloscyllium punctatum]